MRLIVKLIFIDIYIDFMNILLIFINYQLYSSLQVNNH